MGFPDGTSAGREVAVDLISAALGWNILPHNIIRSGPVGDGMVQVWMEQAQEADELDLLDLCRSNHVPPSHFSVLTAYGDEGAEVALVHADDPRLRRMAVFDVIVNNADRKGGHVLTGVDGAVFGVSHEVALHDEDKLRTVLWGWAGTALDAPTLSDLRALAAQLAGPLGDELGEHLTPEELDALRSRVDALIAEPVLPRPDGRNPLPWPEF